MRRSKRAVTLLGVAACFLLIVGSGVANSALIPTEVGYQTDAPPMLRAVAPDSRVQPIITVGEELPDGYMFEAIPDGIAVLEARRGVRQPRDLDGAVPSVSR